LLRQLIAARPFTSFWLQTRDGRRYHIDSQKTAWLPPQSGTVHVVRDGFDVVIDVALLGERRRRRRLT
jgi:hypothetical protein